MKKLVMTAAVVACAGIVSAQVYSANIVGYSKQTVASADLVQILPQFLAGDTGGITVADAFSGVSSGTALYLWNGTGYDNYVTDGAGNWYDANAGYADANAVLIPQAQGMWMVDGGSGSIPLVAGDVPLDATISITLFAGLNMIGNPYPTGLVLNTIDNTPLGSGDAIFSWNGTGYDNYVTDGAGNWYDANAGYADANAVVLPVGRAFWLVCAAGGNMDFNKNF
jgi:hypothetical protein